LPSPAEPVVAGSDPNFFKGSFLVFLLFLPAFLLIILAILVAMQYKQLRAFVSPNSMELFKVPVSSEAQAQVVAKLRAFSSQGEGDTFGDTLALSAEEINHLLRSSPSLEALQLDYHMELKDSLLIARNSLPVERLHGALSFLAKTLRVRGFLNSEMRGHVEFEKNKIKLVPISATMNGVVAPVSVLNRKGGVDPAEWIEDKEFYTRFVGLLSAIEIRNGSLLFIKRP
jgi:hypothetical protein